MFRSCSSLTQCQLVDLRAGGDATLAELSHARHTSAVGQANIGYLRGLLAIRASDSNPLKANMAKDKDPVEEIPRRRILEERPASLSEPLPREKLPKDLQKIIDKEDDLWDTIYDGQYDFLTLLAALQCLHVRNLLAL
jgi:hypothetical protein